MCNSAIYIYIDFSILEAKYLRRYLLFVHDDEIKFKVVNFHSNAPLHLNMKYECEFWFYYHDVIKNCGINWHFDISKCKKYKRTKINMYIYH